MTSPNGGGKPTSSNGGGQPSNNLVGIDESIKNTRANLLKAALNTISWPSGKNAKLLTLGITGAGKSTLMEFIQKGSVKKSKRKPTLSFERINYDFGKFKMTLIDVPGQKAYWDEWKKYIPHAHGILFVIDSAKFDHVQMLHKLIYKKLDLPKLNIPIAFIANKQDLEGSFSADSIYKMLNLDKFDNSMRMFDTSAINGKGVMSALKWFLSQTKQYLVTAM